MDAWDWDKVTWDMKNRVAEDPMQDNPQWNFLEVKMLQKEGSAQMNVSSEHCDLDTSIY